MRAKKGYVLTSILTRTNTSNVYVFRSNGEWGLQHPHVFASRPEAAKQMELRRKRYLDGSVVMKVMSYRDWEKLAVESEISG